MSSRAGSAWNSLNSMKWPADLPNKLFNSLATIFYKCKLNEINIYLEIFYESTFRHVPMIVTALACFDMNLHFVSPSGYYFALIL